MGTKLFLKNSSGQCLKNSSGGFIYKELPPEYQEVEYIESTGTQYINSGVYGNLNTKAEVVSQITETQYSSRFFGSRTNSNDNAFVMGEATNDSWFAHFDSVLPSVLISITKNLEKHTFILSKKGFYVDGQLATSYSNPTSFNTPYPLLIMASYNQDVINAVSYSKLYLCKIWDNDVLVRYFIPCVRNSDNKPGLYDLINGKFYTNAGTGEFTYGHHIDLPETYQQVEYIQSSGTQYINTGVKQYYNSNKLLIDAGACRVAASDFGNFNFGNAYTQFDFKSYTTLAERNHIIVTWDSNTKMEDAWVNDVRKISNKNWTGNTWDSYQILLFNLGNSVSGTPYYETAANYRYWYCQIYNNNILVRNFIPCYRKSDSVIGMYDTVNQQFYTNAGTGTFTKGSNIG